MATVLHTVKEGENLLRLAQRYLYDASRYPEIKQTNNLIKEDLYAGQMLRIITDDDPQQAVDLESVGIEIDGTALVNVPFLSVGLTMGVIAPTFSFTLPNEDVYRKLCTPFQYQPVAINYKKDRILTGILMRSEYIDEPDSSVIKVSGYGKPGVLSDVTLPRATYPRTLYGRNLAEIARAYCRPFGVTVVIDDSATDACKEPWPKSAIEPTETVAEYLVRLAKLRGCFITSDERGRLLIQKERLGTEPILDIEDPQVFHATYDGSKIFSDFYAIREGNRAHSFAEAKKSIRLSAFRHTTVQSRERGGDGPVTDLAASEIGRCMMQAVRFELDLPYVTGKDGALFMPKQLIRVTSPRHGVVQPLFTYIDRVTLTFDEGDAARLTLAPADALTNTWKVFWE